jgi:hypothetical protein
MFDDGFILLLMLAVVVLAPLFFIAKIVFFAFVAKTAYDAYQAHTQAFHDDVAGLEQLAGRSGAQADWNGLLRAAHDMQRAIDTRSRQGGKMPSGPASAQFGMAWSKAQMELNHFDRLSRERADLHLSDMKSQAASMGLFV